eukprot:8441242-Lingulodinium_polyedra.AAC.1
MNWFAKNSQGSIICSQEVKSWVDRKVYGFRLFAKSDTDCAIAAPAFLEGPSGSRFMEDSTP